VLLDYVDFVVHIFSEKARQFYDLERLWKSAKRVEPGGVAGETEGAAVAWRTGDWQINGWQINGCQINERQIHNRQDSLRGAQDDT
jgi:hypothetical protein